MRYYGRRERLQDLIEQYTSVHRVDREENIKKFATLDLDTYTEYQLEESIGSYLYNATRLKCEECKKFCLSVIKFGDEEYDACCWSSVSICIDCIKSFMKEFADLPSPYDLHEINH